MEDACILLKILTSEMSNKTVIKCKKYTTGKEAKSAFYQDWRVTWLVELYLIQIARNRKRCKCILKNVKVRLCKQKFNLRTTSEMHVRYLVIVRYNCVDWSSQAMKSASWAPYRNKKSDDIKMRRKIRCDDDVIRRKIRYDETMIGWEGKWNVMKVSRWLRRIGQKQKR